MGAMFTEPAIIEVAAVETVADEPIVEPATLVIFQDPAHSPLPIRDPKSASLVFRPSGQGCFP